MLPKAGATVCGTAVLHWSQNFAPTEFLWPQAGHTIIDFIVFAGFPYATDGFPAARCYVTRRLNASKHACIQGNVKVRGDVVTAWVVYFPV